MTLREMAKGGMNDQIGGGFHRYSVDERWFVPHFEKMLYDQAQLAMSYLEAFQITRDGQYAAAARDIFTYVLRDMTDPGGGFYSAEDADSASDPANPHEKSEGAFYIWRKQEIEEALGPRGCGDVLLSLRRGSRRQRGGRSARRVSRRNILVSGARRGRHAADRERRVAAGVGEAAGDSRAPAAAAARRQDAGVLERDDDFGVRQGRADPERAALRGGGARRRRIFCGGICGTSSGRFCCGAIATGSRPSTGSSTITLSAAWRLLDLYETTFDARDFEWAVRLAERAIELFEDRRTADSSAPPATADLVLRLKDDYDGAEPPAIRGWRCCCCGWRG